MTRRRPVRVRARGGRAEQRQHPEQTDLPHPLILSSGTPVPTIARLSVAREL
jgi:hypothetical protein